MQITNFTVASDRTKLDLTITDAAGALVLRLWTKDTYKDFSKAIDLTSKLTGSATETIEITPSNINESSFDGIYFIEVEDVNEISTDITSELSRYKECIMERAVQLSDCADCLTSKNVDLVNTFVLLHQLEDAIELRYIDEILVLSKTLDKYCKNDCISCGKHKNVIDNLKYNNSITIKIDGGKIT